MAEGEVGAVAPVVPPVAAEATPEQVSTAEPVSTPEGEQPEKPERTFTQKELDEIVSKRLAKESRRAERLAEERVRREHAERELERLRAEQQPKAQGEPDPKNYGEDWQRYYRDLARWEAKQLLEEERKGYQEQTAQQRQQQEMAEQAQYVQKTIISKGREKYEDFDEVTTSEGVAITHPMLAAATKLKNGPDVLYYLGQNPAESQRIAGLSGVEQAWELKDLGAKLATPATTRTPPPIVPNGSKTTVDKDPSKMTDKEFAEWRRRQIAQRGNR